MTKYNTFNDVENTTLRTWNRCAMMFNILSEHGKAAMKDYAMQFNDADRDLCWEMLDNVRANGYETMRAYVNRVVQNGTVQ